MRVKRFVGDSVNEAVAKLKTEFGRDAVILHTKRIRQGGLFGLFAKRKFEVIGAIDPQAAASSNGHNVGLTAAQNPSPKRKQNTTKAKSKPLHTVLTPSKSRSSAPLDKQPRNETSAKLWPDSIQGVYEQLISTDIPRALAQDLLKSVLQEIPNHQWQDLAKVWNHLNTLVASRIATVEPWDFHGGQKVAVMIGPTGVGKTTTIAKLAANFALIAGKNVGLITVDTYRIAAVDQLKTYGDILGVPLEVAYSPVELRQALAKMSDKDLVLIDTAGRSHRNRIQMGELKSFLQGIEAEIHLVVSATTKEKDLSEVIKFFSDINIDRLIVTKLDETTGYGVMLQAVAEANAPIAFVTNGQNVPEDIEVAEAEKIAELILGE